ncbi:hypothetical protein TNCV_3999921 [Trichonephila clavipes]|nr:hypothetical protein TNCV_3999921 [Trichonephila clavipes]
MQRSYVDIECKQATSGFFGASRHVYGHLRTVNRTETRLKRQHRASIVYSCVVWLTRCFQWVTSLGTIQAKVIIEYTVLQMLCGHNLLLNIVVEPLFDVIFIGFCTSRNSFGFFPPARVWPSYPDSRGSSVESSELDCIIRACDKLICVSHLNECGNHWMSAESLTMSSSLPEFALQMHVYSMLDSGDGHHYNASIEYFKLIPHHKYLQLGASRQPLRKLD